MARTPAEILDDLGKWIAEDSPHGAALRIEVGTAVHRTAAYSATLQRATEMQSVSQELQTPELWKKNGRRAN
jgi:hypothetical protein